MIGVDLAEGERCTPKLYIYIRDARSPIHICRFGKDILIFTRRWETFEPSY